MGLSLVQKVGNYAFYSRLLVLLMQIFFNYLIPDHDAEVFNPPSVEEKGLADDCVLFFLEGFRRWDGVYFMHVAEHGYTYENTLAFFPLFPLMARLLANSFFFPLQYVLNYSSVLLISAFVVNFICFVQAAKILYLLSLRVLGDQTLAFRTAQLFCINPASIFFSAAYSETTFALLSFTGMLQLECGNTVLASIIFGISGLSRSNGLVNAGFILYSSFNKFANNLTNLSKLSERDNVYVRAFVTFGRTCISTVGNLLLCFLPFILYQFAAYRIFCDRFASSKTLKPAILNYGNEQKYKMAHTGLSPWCYESVPLSYSYVQNTHWNVGFLKYYEWKQLPNFLLASPMTLICLAALLLYLRRNFALFMSFGLHQPADDSYKKTEEMALESQRKDYGFYNRRCYVYLVHMTFLALTACLFMHVQVITRFIASSCPIVYWFISHITTPEEQFKPVAGKSEQNRDPDPVQEPDPDPHTTSNDSKNCFIHESAKGDSANLELATEDLLDWDNSSFFKQAILVYFHLYMFVGIAAFSNFLPWT